MIINKVHKNHIKCKLCGEEADISIASYRRNDYDAPDSGLEFHCHKCERYSYPEEQERIAMHACPTCSCFVKPKNKDSTREWIKSEDPYFCKCGQQVMSISALIMHIKDTHLK